jgi:hypothetical protein
MDSEPPQWFTQTPGLARSFGRVSPDQQMTGDTPNPTVSLHSPSQPSHLTAADTLKRPGDREAAGMRLTESRCGNAKIGTKRDG